jgi:hypothetical protein
VTGDGGGSQGAPPPPSSAASVGGTGAVVVRPGAPVEVGLYISKNATAYGNAFGLGQYYSTFDQEAQARALVADINKRGGLAGHPIRAVFASLDAGSAQPFAVQEQASCDTFTQDHHVVVVLNPYVGIVAGLDDCLAKRGVPLVESGMFQHDRSWFAKGGRFNLEEPTVERSTPALLDSLVRRQLVRTTSKVGLLAYDVPAGHHQVDTVWRPAFTARGLQLTDVSYVYQATSTADLGRTLSDLQSTVLRWKARGIDTVAEQDTLISVFATAAAKQDFHPFYALTSNGSPNATYGLSRSERFGGIGWSSYYDTGVDGNHNAAYTRCERLSGSSGGTSWNSDGTGRSEALMACDAFDVLTRAVSLTGAASAVGVARGVSLLGRAVQSGWALGLRLDASHPDGVSAHRDLLSSTDCSCVRYTSGLTAFP